jgi:ATP-dependent DNA helicase RecG
MHNSKRLNPSMTSSPDWIRLQKALSVEAEKGFTNLQGNQHRFHEFLHLTFKESCPVTTEITASKWRNFAQEYAQYPYLTLSQRQVLVANTRQFLIQLKQSLEAPQTPPKPKLPQTKPLGHTTPQNPYLAPITLETPLKDVPNIGKGKSPYLERLGLITVRDLLFYYPRDHIDYARQVSIANLTEGETVTIVGTINRFHCFTSPKNKKLTILEIILRDPTGQLKINRFFAGTRFSNRGWQEKMKKDYPLGANVAASGLVKKNKYGITLDNPELEVLEHHSATIESLKIGRVLPVYPLTEGVGADLVRNSMLTVLPLAENLRDPLPAVIRDQYGFIKLKDAIKNIHFPQDGMNLIHARRRLVFDEFFYLQLGFLQRRKEQKDTEKSAIFHPEGELIKRFNKLLPFRLTNAQQRVINEILADLTLPTPMNRLVQGDVGAGKTVVAVFAILAAIQSGYQAALMAPTEVLAEQHYRKLVGWFNLLHLPVELLTGSTKTKKRREIHAQLETGELPLLVGTHALIQDGVNFSKLGLVVIDEQHRFGVQQRARLLSKGEAPHVLTMTATPIPRTLALTLHGDLDVSQVDELPPGRQPIQTTAVNGHQRPQVFDLIRREIVQGRQVYIIFPLIEESEKLDVRAATKEYERLKEKIFPEFQIGLLHGKMKSEEKDEVLTGFRDNKYQIIVSTTVIEVGVDVPNATVMLIENAERFGLSQLHQLRGRVGRGNHQSHCILMSGSNTPDAKQRLAVLEQSQDGFFISEMDLRLRGPGEVLGKKQSGLADFALASLVEDQDVLMLARDAAEKILLADKSLNNLPSLKQELEARYQRMIGGTVLN